MLFIGDVHGKVEDYLKIVKHSKESIQLGDFGFQAEHDWHLANIDSDKHKVLFGNHDWTHYRKTKPHSLGDFGIYRDMFYVAGGDSLDKNLRMEGVSWFRDEELSIRDGEAVIDLYAKTRPSVVITHVPPDEILVNKKYYLVKSRTAQILNSCLSIHRPDIWVFGHMHEYIELNLFGTYFIGLDELQTIEI